MSTPPEKKIKVDLPQCPYGSKCYRKNPAHLKEFSHSDQTSTVAVPKVVSNDVKKTLPVCPFGATCYRKNLLHFSQYSHPFDLLNPDAESSDEEKEKEKEKEENNQSDKKKNETNDQSKKRKAEKQNIKTFDDNDSDKTEEYDSDDESVYDVKLEKTFSQMTEDERRLMIERAFELKDKLQEKLKKSREEAEQKKQELEQLQHQVNEGVLLMEGEDEVLKGNEIKYFELFPARNYKQGSAAEVHFRLAESQYYRLLSGQASAQVSKVEYVCNPKLIDKFNKAREELKKNRGENYSYPVLAFHGTAITNIKPICETGFKVPGQKGFAHATDTGYYGRGTYFSEYPGYSMGYIKGANKLLLCQILQGKVYKCTQLIMGADLQDGFDSHCSPDGKELIIFRSDYILPQYIVHYALNAGEFKYAVSPETKEEIRKKLNNIVKLYKKAVKTKDKVIFSGYKIAFVGKMADTPIAIETLVKRFGGTFFKKPATFGGLVTTFGFGFGLTQTYEVPTMIICSLDEYEAATRSDELQSYINYGYQAFYREDFLYESIIDGMMKPLASYQHE